MSFLTGHSESRRPVIELSVDISMLFNEKLYNFNMTLPDSAAQAVIAKFHYTGPTGPDQTKSADFVGDPRGPARTLSETRVCGPGLATDPVLAKKSVRIRAGPRGSGRARVVEFNLYRSAFVSRSPI